MRGMSHPWSEIADGVFVRRYAAFDQNIVAIVGRGEAVVVDTRSTDREAREVLADLRALGSPQVTAVVNTHGHFDHAYGNRTFRPAPIWGHVRSVAMVLDPSRRASAASWLPELADEVRAVVLDPPDRTFESSAAVEVGGRVIQLAFLGRGHTDNDIVITVDGADVLLAGDLLENGAAPQFGDAFPLDWAATAEVLAGLVGPATVVVPGHGDAAGRSFAQRQAREFDSIVALARQVDAGDLDLEAAVAASPYSPGESVEPLERAIAQLRGELG